jgi:hypothetical protein
MYLSGGVLVLIAGRLAEGVVDQLEDDKEAAEAYRQKEADFYCLSINSLKWRKQQCIQNINQVKGQVSKLEEKKAYEDEKQAKVKSELQELEVCICRQHRLIICRVCARLCVHSSPCACCRQMRRLQKGR